ncbi:MAG: T9SS type A sorting domain-containing protein [Saprospiraceae bacterium]|nr:T9SS type A sorting domain-containing protein [Saprospiraceae bacterium]
MSTFDLVLISKHILGVTPLGSPYKIIAADANRSNSVTTFDLVEIRKLILFINSDFPNNTSWRFVDAAHSFANPANPFAASFPEVVNLNDVVVDQLNRDFVAVKVGDVNGSAAVNLLGSAEERNKVGDLVLNADDMELVAGQEYTVEFKATDFNVSGYQFSMNFDAKALEFAGIAAGLADASNFGTTMVKEGVLTASWNSDDAKALANGEVVFGLTFRALQSGRLSEQLSISSSHTAAEAYSSTNGLMNVALSFNNKLVTGSFDLYQNTPNPFASVTTIGFYLPEATSATLTISDVQGKVVRVIEGDYSKGHNTVNLKRDDFGAAGVLYYRLDAGSDSATRKMILVD